MAGGGGDGTLETPRQPSTRINHLAAQQSPLLGSLKHFPHDLRKSLISTDNRRIGVGGFWSGLKREWEETNQSQKLETMLWRHGFFELINFFQFY